MNLQGALVAPFLIQCLPQLSLHCFFFMNKIKQELRSSDSSAMRLHSQWCGAALSQAGDTDPSHLGPQQVCHAVETSIFSRLQATRKIPFQQLEAYCLRLLAFSHTKVFVQGSQGQKGGQPPCASAEGQPPGANLLTQSSTS